MMIALLLALWASFVKKSTQAAFSLFILFLWIAYVEHTPSILFLFISSILLLVVSLLIPKQNPRLQKRRFFFRKTSYVVLLSYFAFVLSGRIEMGSDSVRIVEPHNLEPLLLFFLPLVFLVFVIFLLFTRQHVR